MIEVKGFAGIMDTDDPITGIPQGFHMMANNGRFKGVNGLYQFENIEGNREIVFTKPAGDNECMGSFYDSVGKNIYWCNWNSNNNHCIYEIYTPTETVTRILQSGINTDGDILNFDLNNPIHSMDMVYGSEGNILTFVDSLGRPTEINLNLFKNTPYTNTQRSYIDVAKCPFAMPPKVSYENDENATANNFRNALFQFASRPVYDYNEKPVYSIGSEVPLPYLPFDQTVLQDVTKNSRIAIYITTGDESVQGMEIIGRKAQDGLVGDWFKIIALDKSDLSIPNNSVYRYLFYNDSAYPTVPTEGTDPSTQVLNLQDSVPQKANTQALLNGDVLGYAGITEGYDKVNAILEIDSIISSDGRADNKNGILFFASQSGLFSVGTGNDIEICLSGVGDNDNTTNEPITLSNSLNTKFYVRAQTASGTDKSFYYLETTADASIPTVLANISTAAQAIGYTQVSIGANTLVLSYSGIVLLSSQTFTTEASSTDEAIFANAQRATYSYGIQYYDSKGRTNGVTYGASFDTNPDTGTSSLFELKIYHRPPIWAVWYNVVRTKNTTFNKLFTWVSDSAYSNNSAVDNVKYAYIGISGIAEYNLDISSSSNVASYEFQKGDRIRFVERYELDGSADSTGYTNLDYEVLGTVPNPIIDGEVKTGTYIKILYPTNDITADFKLDDTDEFQNYKIILYNPADKLDKNLEFFYEWGQQYGIVNAGTINAYHAGMIASQSEDLTLPAKILLDKGDYFFRYRNVVSGVLYTAKVGGNRYSNRYSTARVEFVSDVTNTEYEIRSNDAHPAGLLSTDYPTYTDTDYNFYNKDASPVNVRIQATVLFKADDVTAVDIYLKELNNTMPYAAVVITTIASGISVAAGETITATIDGIYFVAPAGKIWLLFGNTNMVLSVSPQITDIKFTVLKYTNISIVEKSFSDLYDLELSANSRASLIDENAAQIYYPTKFRWGGGYLQDTNINNINRFYAPNYDEWDRAKGDVRRLKVRERLLKIFQDRAVGQVGIYTKFVQDSGGSQILTTTDDIITQNNINYYEGEYGMGNYPTSLVSTAQFDAFVDPIRGYQVISDQSGLRAINEIYLGQYYIRGLLTTYNKTWTKADGSRAKIMGVYNYIDEEYNCILEGGTNGSETIGSNNFSFNAKRKGYSNFFDWHPEWTMSAQEKIYSWQDGKLYVHDDTSAGKFCNFYGVQYDCFLIMPFNSNMVAKKGWQGMTQLANVVWSCPEIYTQVISYDSLYQQSNLVLTDFRLKEGRFHASFLRDVNSVKGIANGDRLKGSYIVIKFQPTSSSNFVFLAAVTVKYLNSPLIPE